ncbi:MAG: hypothetical protein AAF843_04170 [Bacteroidota bacterium]
MTTIDKEQAYQELKQDAAKAWKRFQDTTSGNYTHYSHEAYEISDEIITMAYHQFYTYFNENPPSYLPDEQMKIIHNYHTKHRLESCKDWDLDDDEDDLPF